MTKVRALAAGAALVVALTACKTSTESEQARSEEARSEEPRAQVTEPQSPTAAEQDEETTARVEALESPEVRPGQAPAGDDAPSKVPMWRAEGLEVQPRFEAFVREVQDMGFEPAVTAWRAYDAGPKPALTDETSGGGETPGALLWKTVDVINAANSLGQEQWELTLRVLETGPSKATGIIMKWGFKDDAVIGNDVRVHMRRVKERWLVDTMEERVYCARGVTAEGLCL
jgi:hypothetical protein